MLSRVAISLSLSMFVLPAVCQRPAARQNVTVRVLNASTTPGSPVRDARVAITYLADGTPITDALKTTNAAGEAYLVISRDRAEQGDLRVELSGVNELAVYRPADGQLAGISDRPVLLLLLPKGSVALLGPPQIEATLKRLSLHVSALQQQNRSLRGQLASANTPKDALAEAMAEWAKSNGFPEQEVQDKVREWAEDIQAHAQQKSQEQKALAQFALKNYAAAGDSFQQASKSAFARAGEVRREVEERNRQYHESLAQALSDAARSSQTLQLALQYHRATAALHDASNSFQQLHQESPNDDQVKNLWLQARGELANAEFEEGEVVTGSDNSGLLSQAVEELKGLAAEYEGRSDKGRWASTQNNLGIALVDQGERTSGKASAALFAQAVQACEHALEVDTKADLPQEWASTQNNLGIALVDQGERTSGKMSTALFAQAVQACEHALEVDTKADLPQDWARTQNNLGAALMDQGERTSGQASAALFARAVQAYQSALEVCTKADLPQDWARTQNNLGNALSDQGERNAGGDSAALFAQAVRAYEHSLEIYTKADLPQDWARTQNNLGNTFRDEGERTSGDASTVLLGAAVKAYERALEVSNKADLPQIWAGMQSNLGIALVDQGEMTSGEASTLLFAKAVQAYELSLEIYTKADLPQGWARTQNNLGNVFVNQGERTSGEASAALFAEAVQAYEHALEVRTRADLPQDWATTQTDLSFALVDQGERTSGEASTPLFAKAVQACEHALEVRTKADLPQDWARTQNSLGNAFVNQGERTSGEASAALFAQAVQAYEHALEVRTKAGLPQDWAATQNNLGIALRNQGERAPGEASTALFAQALQAFESALEVRTKADLPQDWAATQYNLGRLSMDLHDYAAADRNLTGTLEIYPQSAEVLSLLGAISHDNLFQFDRAYELMGRRLKLNSSAGARLDFAEASLSANHAADCVAQMPQITDAGIMPQLLTVRDTLKLACQWANSDPAAALSTARLLASKAAGVQKPRFSFVGTIHFLTISPVFSKGRSSWISLFQSVQDGNGKAMATALQQLEEMMQH